MSKRTRTDQPKEQKKCLSLLPPILLAEIVSYLPTPHLLSSILLISQIFTSLPKYTHLWKSASFIVKNREALQSVLSRKFPIRSLVMDCDTFTSEDFVSLHSLPSLTSLKFSREFSSPMISSLKGLPLKSLPLTMSQIDQEHHELCDPEYYKLLEDFPLENLSLFQPIPQQLKEILPNLTIKRLYIQSIDYGRDWQIGLHQILESSPKTLQSILLQQGYLDHPNDNFFFHLPELERLTLTGLSSLTNLQLLEHFTKLKKLALLFVKIEETQLNFSKFMFLQELNLSFTNITGKCLNHLNKLSQLRILLLRGCSSLDFTSLTTYLNQLPLEVLDVSECPNLKEMVPFPVLSQLYKLDISGTDVDVNWMVGLEDLPLRYLKIEYGNFRTYEENRKILSLVFPKAIICSNWS